MTTRRIPIVILAGSDRRAVELPADGRDAHPLSGYKGVDIRIGDGTLLEAVIQRLRASDRFSQIHVLGPASVFGFLDSVSLINADGSFGDNVAAAIRAVRGAHPSGPIAFITCDVLPEVETLTNLMVQYDEEGPNDLWYPLIRAPEDRTRLGASAWKPAYRIVPAEGCKPVGVLPGHLVVVDPDGLRLNFVCRLIGLGYRTRNRSITYRRGVMIRGVVLALLYQDLLHLIAFRAPNLTWSVLSVGIAAGREIKAGTITRARLEDALRKIFVTARHRKRNPERRFLMPIVDGISLALDIDTEEEARAAGGDVSKRSA